MINTETTVHITGAPPSHAALRCAPTFTDGLRFCLTAGVRRTTLNAMAPGSSGKPARNRGIHTEKWALNDLYQFVVPGYNMS